MARASESKLAALHNQLADTLTELVGSEEVAPSTLAVAAKFLKDNSIFATPEQTGAMDDMKTKLEARRKARKLTHDDLGKALGDIGRDMLQ